MSQINGNSPTINLTFYKHTSSGSVALSKESLAANQHSKLDISKDSPYYAISTENCFAMTDNQSLSMGGFGT